MEGALKHVFTVHRKIVRDVRLQLHQALQEKDQAVQEKEQIKKSLEQRCSELQQDVERLEQEKQCLLATLSTKAALAVCDKCHLCREKQVKSVSSADLVEGGGGPNGNLTEQLLERQIKSLAQTLSWISGQKYGSHQNQHDGELTEIVTNQGKGDRPTTVPGDGKDRRQVVGSSHKSSSDQPTAGTTTTEDSITISDSDSSDAPRQQDALGVVDATPLQQSAVIGNKNQRSYDGGSRPRYTDKDGSIDGADPYPQTTADKKKTDISPKLQLARGSAKRKRYVEDLSESKRHKKSPGTSSSRPHDRSSEPLGCIGISSAKATAGAHREENVSVEDKDNDKDNDLTDHEVIISESRSTKSRQQEKCSGKRQMTMELFRISKNAAENKTGPKRPSSSSQGQSTNILVPETCQLDTYVARHKHSPNQQAHIQPLRSENVMCTDVNVVPETLATHLSFNSDSDDGGGHDDNIGDLQEGDAIDSLSTWNGSRSESSSDSCTPKAAKFQLTPYPADGDISLSDSKFTDKREDGAVSPAHTRGLSGEQKNRTTDAEQCHGEDGLSSRSKKPSLGKARPMSQSAGMAGARQDSVVFDSTRPVGLHHSALAIDIPSSGRSVVCEGQSYQHLSSPVFTGHKVDTSEISPALFEDAVCHVDQEFGVQHGGDADMTLAPEGTSQGSGISKQTSFQRTTPSTPKCRSKVGSVSAESPDSPLLLRPLASGFQRQPQNTTGDVEEVRSSTSTLNPSVSLQPSDRCQSVPQVGEMERNPDSVHRRHSHNHTSQAATPVRPLQHRQLFRAKQSKPACPSADDTVHPSLLDARTPLLEQELNTTKQHSRENLLLPEKKDDQATSTGLLSPRRTQLNASLDPGVRLTQYLGDSPVSDDDPCLPPEDAEDADLTLDPRFQRAHQTSAQDITLISQSSNATDIVSSNKQDKLGLEKRDASNTARSKSMADLDDSFDRAPVKKDQRKYAYTEVVRKQADRRKLKGFSCQECLQYYRSIGLTDEAALAKMTHCSRHRAHYAPPSTPEHFWSIGFPDTQECQERGYHN